MATISRNFAARQQHDWNAGVAWATGAPTTAAVTLSDTEQFTADIDLETAGLEAAEIIVNLDYAGTTDDVIISLYASTTLDGSYTGNELAFYSRRVNSTATEDDVSFIVEGYSHVRIGLVVTGGTDAHTSDWQYYQAWNWTSA